MQKAAKLPNARLSIFAPKLICEAGEFLRACCRKNASPNAFPSTPACKVTGPQKARVWNKTPLLALICEGAASRFPSRSLFLAGKRALCVLLALAQLPFNLPQKEMVVVAGQKAAANFIHTQFPIFPFHKKLSSLSARSAGVFGRFAKESFCPLVASGHTLFLPHE